MLPVKLKLALTRAAVLDTRAGRTFRDGHRIAHWQTRSIDAGNARRASIVLNLAIPLGAPTDQTSSPWCCRLSSATQGDIDERARHRTEIVDRPQ